MNNRGPKQNGPDKKRQGDKFNDDSDHGGVPLTIGSGIAVASVWAAIGFVTWVRNDASSSIVVAFLILGVVATAWLVRGQDC